MYQMTPKQLRQYIDHLRKNHLALKHNIEKQEFFIEQNQCPECDLRLQEELFEMYDIAYEMTDLPKVTKSLEEYLAEDEAINGWKGEDRIIEL